LVLLKMQLTVSVLLSFFGSTGITITCTRTFMAFAGAIFENCMSRILFVFCCLIILFL
jgi:hypothetical protein